MHHLDEKAYTITFPSKIKKSSILSGTQLRPPGVVGIQAAGLFPPQPSLSPGSQVLLPLSLHCPPRAKPPACPGTLLQGLPAQGPSELAQEVGLGAGSVQLPGASCCPRADPANASWGHFLDSHHGASLGHDKYPRWLETSARGLCIHRGPSTEASTEKGKQSGCPSSPCQRWHPEDPSGAGEGGVLCSRRPEGLQVAVEPLARRTSRLSQAPPSPCPSHQGPPELWARTWSLEGGSRGQGCVWGDHLLLLKCLFLAGG